MIIEGKLKVELGVKRFYLQGVKIKSNCPTCGRECIFDGDIDYVSYPRIGEVEAVHIYCEDCYEAFVEKVIINIDIIQANTNE